MDTASLSEWLDQHIWPQIQTMMLNDAYFKLMGRARELTGEFNGPIGWLVEIGYVTSQTLAIRRLCDSRKDVISIRRLLVEAQKTFASNDQIEKLSQKLDSCAHICELVNNYVAHTANPLRRQNVSDWNLQVGHLADAQKAICEVAVIFDRDLLRRKNYVALIPVPQSNIMQEFRNWMPQAMIEKLWEFWHAHNETVNAWIPQTD
jgi:hypothetical protein